MTRFERAAQLWPLLTLTASQRHVITYDILARVTGMARNGFGPILEPIQSYCLLNKLPALTSLVVSVKTGIPGEGFVAAENVPAEQAAVFTWPWFERKPPTAPELAAATERLPSNGKSIDALKQELKKSSG